jgi:two-component system sensor kinase FixL
MSQGRRSRPGAPDGRHSLDVVEDGSGSKELDEALAAASAFRHALFEAAVDAILTIAASGRIDTSTPAAARLFGYAAAYVLGGNVSILMPSPFR